MRILAIIPARGGSKGLPGKNIRPLAGKPLMAHSIDVARACPLVTEVVVSSDSDEIGDVAMSHGALFVKRPAELAQDTSPTEPVLQHSLLVRERETQAFDAVLFLQPTSPLRSLEDVSEAIRLFSERSCDTLFSAYVFHGYRYRYEDGIAHKLYEARGRRQDREEEYVENGAIYLARAELIREGKLFGERLSLSVMPQSRSVDIDTIEDLRLAEACCSLVTPHSSL